MGKIRVVKNLGIGCDNIEHLVGKEFDVHSVEEDELIIIHEGTKTPLDHEEYEYV